MSRQRGPCSQKVTDLSDIFIAKVWLPESEVRFTKTPEQFWEPGSQKSFWNLFVMLGMYQKGLGQSSGRNFATLSHVVLVNWEF